MADMKISALPAATDLVGAVIPIVQGGANKKAAAGLITPSAIGAATAAHTQAASTISDSTAAGRELLTGADASAQRTSLGLGTAATTAATAYATAAQGATADSAIQGDGTILQTVALTQAAYDALTPKVATTLYVITD